MTIIQSWNSTSRAIHKSYLYCTSTASSEVERALRVGWGGWGLAVVSPARRRTRRRNIFTRPRRPHSRRRLPESPPPPGEEEEEGAAAAEGEVNKYKYSIICIHAQGFAILIWISYRYFVQNINMHKYTGILL